MNVLRYAKNGSSHHYFIVIFIFPFIWHLVEHQADSLSFLLSSHFQFVHCLFRCEIQRNCKCAIIRVLRTDKMNYPHQFNSVCSFSLIAIAQFALFCHDSSSGNHKKWKHPESLKKLACKIIQVNLWSTRFFLSFSSEVKKTHQITLHPKKRVVKKNALFSSSLILFLFEIQFFPIIKRKLWEKVEKYFPNNVFMQHFLTKPSSSSNHHSCA